MNQCDGCVRGAPVVEGMHVNDSGLPYMVCQAGKYVAQPAITEPGRYRIKTKAGTVAVVRVADRNGELGVPFRMTGEFIPVDRFVGVEVLERLD